METKCAPDCQERADCPDAGKAGHSWCGTCPSCEKPRHHCGHVET